MLYIWCIPICVEVVAAQSDDYTEILFVVSYITVSPSFNNITIWMALRAHYIYPLPARSFNQAFTVRVKCVPRCSHHTVRIIRFPLIVSIGTQIRTHCERFLRCPRLLVLSGLAVGLLVQSHVGRADSAFENKQNWHHIHTWLEYYQKIQLSCAHLFCLL
jgi:hypothetical protein